MYTKVFELYSLYTQLKLDLIVDVADQLYPYMTPAESGQRIGAPRAPQLQIHSIQLIKLTGSTPIQRRLRHRALELTQSKKITAQEALRAALGHPSDGCRSRTGGTYPQYIVLLDPWGLTSSRIRLIYNLSCPTTTPYSPLPTKSPHNGLLYQHFVSPPYFIDTPWQGAEATFLVAYSYFLPVYSTLANMPRFGTKSDLESSPLEPIAIVGMGKSS